MNQPILVGAEVKAPKYRYYAQKKESFVIVQVKCKLIAKPESVEDMRVAMAKTMVFVERAISHQLACE